jgi:hypothetical protein
MFLTVIKSIFADKKAIFFVVIVFKKNIIVNWFIKNINSILLSNRHKLLKNSKWILIQDLKNNQFLPK